MSYEKRILEDLKMPKREKVEEALLLTLYKYNGSIKEFSADEPLVEEIADQFLLNQQQRNSYLETTYRKENRLKKSNVWHRLLFRAADALAKEKLISRPTQTVLITNKKEWMLTEDGYDKLLDLLHLPASQKESSSIKTFEVQKAIKNLHGEAPPVNYDPIGSKKASKVSIEIKIRERGFRLAIIEAYKYACAVCGMKICSPDNFHWEVEAAHIVPHRLNGKDDLWNGLSLCRFHHWAFDVGWFTINDDFTVLPSSRLQVLSENLGRMGKFQLMDTIIGVNINLPEKKEIYPHKNSILWHRQNIFIN